MTHLRSSLVAAGLIVLCGSCVSFRVARTAPGEHRVELLIFCPRVEEDEDIMKAVDAKSEFSAADREICCLITVRLVDKPLRLRWKWYAPDKTLWRDSGEVPWESPGPPVALISAYDRVVQDDEGIAKGTWTVAVFLNGQLAARAALKII